MKEILQLNVDQLVTEELIRFAIDKNNGAKIDLSVEINLGLEEIKAIQTAIIHKIYQTFIMPLGLSDEEIPEETVAALREILDRTTINLFKRGVFGIPPPPEGYYEDAK